MPKVTQLGSTLSQDRLNDIIFRCDDPTELGTMSSAIKCKKCKKGAVISSDTKDLEADWTCQECGAKMSYDAVQKVFQGMLLNISK